MMTTGMHATVGLQNGSASGGTREHFCIVHPITAEPDKAEKEFPR